MKKFLVLTLTLICLLSLVLASCNNNNNTTTPIDDDDDIRITLASTTVKGGTGGTNNSAEWVEVNEDVWVVNVLSANVRKEKSQSATSLGICKLGEKYKRLGWDYDWSLIEFGGKQGYVLTVYLTTDNGDIVFNAVNQIRIVTDPQGWYLRQRPDKNNSLLIAPKDAELKQTGISLSGKWARFEYKLTEDKGNLKAGDTVILYAYDPDASSVVKQSSQTTTTSQQT